MTQIRWNAFKFNDGIESKRLTTVIHNNAGRTQLSEQGNFVLIGVFRHIRCTEQHQLHLVETAPQQELLSED